MNLLRNPEPDGTPLSARLRALADDIDCPAVDLPSGAKGDRVLLLATVADRLRLEQARAVGAFDADGLWASDGARSVSGWVSSRALVSSGRAAHLAGKARELRAAAAVEASWEAGRLCEETAFALLGARKIHPVLFDEHVDQLLGWIDGLRVDHALTAIRHWLSIARDTLAAEKAEGTEGTGDPDDATPADPAVENTVSISQTFDGRWYLTADYDPVTGALINERAKAWIDRQFAHGTYRSDDGLTYSQRIAAALDALTEAGAVTGQTRHGEPRPAITLHLDAKTLAGEPCEDFDDAMSRRCHLDDGTPVPRSTAERMMCGARLKVIATLVADLGLTEVIGITDLVRDATPQQRLALKLRWQGCAFTGCHAPFDWCEIHHLLPWEDGGLTDLENLLPLCKYHHHLCHEGGWTLWRASDGNLYLTKPDGTPVAITQPGQLIDLHAPAPTAPSPAPRRKGELRFLTPRERTARIAERNRRIRERDAQQTAQAAADERAPAQPTPPTRTGSSVFGPARRPRRRTPSPSHRGPGNRPPQQGPPRTA